MESRTLSVDGRSIHCVVAGTGPVLLLLHGWPTHSGLYRNILPALSPHRRVIALDLPGFGRSAKPTDVRYGFSFFSRVIDGVLEALEVEDLGIVVHDLGGPIGLHWAVEHAERITELAVLNTLVFTDFHWMVKLFMASVSLPGVSRAITSPYGIRGSMRLGMTTRPGRDVLDVYTTPFTSPSDRKALAMAGRQLGLGKFGRIAERLPTLKVPTLLLYGTGDRILPDVERTMTRLAEIWPHATKTALPGLGHFLQEDDPALVGEHMVRFLGERG